MADFTRMSAAEADTELREMRQLLLTKQTQLQAGGKEARATTRRIQAINRAMQSLANEGAVQGKLLEVRPTRLPAEKE
ncbi:hypothetical protein Q5H93_02915 [Hymenobacter sp. ASUV-10]|uniref:50S ribosomal protein L29 n=1 Tax=Hymenobacter aranciens TaxID=3063996 RepID=A0ABT9B7A1_9BACT|nr:hypothetical protein [Hymenobacter sp. ASUV-10]MDO7873670.1 hypothetical protein [Hymenobacter sp. ASUV-10]